MAGKTLHLTLGNIMENLVQKRRMRGLLIIAVVAQPVHDIGDDELSLY